MWKNVFLAGWACERGRKLNEVLSHWMKSGHKLQFRLYISINTHYTWNNNKSANLLRIITDKDQAKDLRCLVLQEILVIWLGTTLKSYNKGQWKIAVKMLQLLLQCRYKNSKNKGARKTLMALQTNALMSTFRYLCTTIKNKVWQFCSTFWHKTSCFNFDERQRESLDHNNMSKVLARHPFSPKDRHCNLGWGAKKEKMFLGILL